MWARRNHESDIFRARVGMRNHRVSKMLLLVDLRALVFSPYLIVPAMNIGIARKLSLALVQA